MGKSIKAIIEDVHGTDIEEYKDDVCDAWLIKDRIDLTNSPRFLIVSYLDIYHHFPYF